MKIINVVGGLGSQMMAYSLSLALKRKFPKEKVICDFSAYHHFNRIDHNGSELKKAFGINEDQVPIILRSILHSRLFPWRVIRKILFGISAIRWHDAISNKYNYDASVYDQRGSVVYHQVWTSWKYFSSVENQVRERFTFPDISSSDIRNEACSQKIMVSNSVCIHMRLGDYIGNRVLGNLIDASYYKRAIDKIKGSVKNPIFFVFSDDGKKCKEYLKEILQDECYFIDWNIGKDSYIDMKLMSKCKHHIIPNSSFSWWGAYLANHQNQIVIAPKIWSNSETGIELRDMNLPQWIVIDNMASRDI